ncbi:MAG: inositol monophosphatase family protein [Roseofilum sp. SBFL]|uniref:3'(2'),5'-bisphosphate nucleotidase CysQ family protein n=1 Tax=unclassified Roseofilum TaxID=2620099 RepID=UPI001B07F9CC|nr:MULTISPECIES: inositol monophosphatase family protein [unclassified Roseofilum]MBP0015146.1 inositol monophosphatase family protein [Roseofilum sp. SID3]MBP0023960.1 inositol monophosphatase family protein [Roseofilum sp. SID2]MBP0039188.1 inositol monophosphatase family protein [Roseofilum sp. SID1]MBP0043298.1 inositol monophosphatase family protein [Roseofilum sp. SBFL]
MDHIASEFNPKITQVLQECGQQIEFLSESFEVDQKGPGDYVTNVDRYLDRKLSQVFGGMFPQDGIISEENEVSRRLFHQGYEQLWCIDPLDGTEGLVNGRQDYAVMVGLLRDYQPIAGWVYAPARARLYYGGQDWGLFEIRSQELPKAIIPQIPPSPSTSFCPVQIGFQDRKKYGQALTQFVPHIQFYSLGSFGLKVLEVIFGRVGLYFYFNRRVKLWDTVGPIALAQRAGLICCDLEGQPLEFSPNAIHPDTLAHEQMIVIGWPEYIEALLPGLQKAVYSVQGAISTS